MGEVHKFPTPPMTAEGLAGLQGMFNTSWWVTRLELELGDIEEITVMGPWVSSPGSELNEALLRINAIARALIGPGRVRLGEGLEVIRDLVEDLLRGVPQ